MKFVLFCHSLTSDWNRGSGHFLRGIATELQARGHDVVAYEPADGWSLASLLATEGPTALDGFRCAYPHLRPRRYTLATLDIDRVLDGADVVLVHECNPPQLLERLGLHHLRARSPYILLFHDSHHRAVSAPAQLEAYPLEHFDGTLAFGAAVADVYRRLGWGRRVWVWHEAADTRLFRPLDAEPGHRRDLIWIGNWGDDERAAELHTFLYDAARAAGVNGSVYGMRYPAGALYSLRGSGLEYCGWAPNYRVPRLLGQHRFTVHVPRSFYRNHLPGVPTIRVFEALACGIPLVCAPWSDSESLFRPGRDYLVAQTGEEMSIAMRALAADPELARELADAGLRTIRSRHSCAHRVDELLRICSSLRPALAGELRSVASCA